ncbi:MAG: membrane dipeptidase [Oleispira sp.]|jgi:microsomal dipeptidase-like Zn-dependent dipeptidase
MKKIILFFISLVLLAGIAYWLLPPLNVEKYFSPVINVDTSANSFAVTYEVENLFVADMHADTLLWNRDITQKSTLGHADIYRLTKANVGLQVFMSIIEAPNDTSSDSIKQQGDRVTSIALLDKWPSRTFISYKERALYHAEKLFKAEKSSNGQLKVIRSKQDLRAGIQNWQAQKNPLLALLGMEGAHGTEFNINNLSLLFDAGYRSMELAHYSDTLFAGSSSGMNKYGLTDKGKALVKEMNVMGMIIDVAHLSNAGIEDVLAMSTRPVYVSHGGAYATCPKARNLPDNIIKEIAKGKGIIGIGFFIGAICGKSLNDLVRAIKHVRNLVGSEYVALGSGWDIASLAIAPHELPDLTRALLKEGFSEKELRNIMGGNVTRFFLENLPSDENPSI